MGKPLKAIDFDIKYAGGGKIPVTLAVVLETGKEVFEKWKKKPDEVNEGSVKEMINKTIDKVAFRYKYDDKHNK